MKVAKLSGYVKSFDETKYMSLLIKVEQLLKNLMKYGTKLVALLTKNLLANQFIIINTIIKYCDGKYTTNFHCKEILPKDAAEYTYICLPIILIHSVFKICENYYPQLLLEECKYAIKLVKACTGDVDFGFTQFLVNEKIDKKTLFFILETIIHLIHFFVILSKILKIFICF